VLGSTLVGEKKIVGLLAVTEIENSRPGVVSVPLSVESNGNLGSEFDTFSKFEGTFTIEVD